IGIVWALFYGIVASLDAGAFSQAIFDGSSSYSNPIYFSFATLTTLGYGDIVPVSPIARVLTSFEAIVGQMYPSILIARLVSGYVSQHLK
ncbi:MAG: ion channel, partial [Cyanobacteria bacterium J06641_5]